MNSNTSQNISITPISALIDEPVQILLSGFALDVRVTLHAHTQDDANKEWASQATFVTDENGSIDVSKESPIAGTYRDANPMGLFWSLHLTNPIAKKQSPLFTKTKLTTSTVITFTAVVHEEIVATTQIERLHMAQDVTEIPVRENSLVGTLYMPAGTGPFPGMLVLSGSDGFIRDRGAALLASHGYAAFALVYFGREGVPAQLANIPLEYFEKGIQWLQQQPKISSDKIGVFGTSRGGELALLLGARFSQIKAVIASAPSGIVHGAVSTNSRLAGWTYGGRPIAFSVGKPNFSDVVSYLLMLMTHKPVSIRETFLRELTNKDRVEKATIPVEKIQGPIMLISGEDDKLWPSTIYADMIVDRLSKHNFPHSYTHLKYKGAGHFVGIPYSFPNMPPSIVPLSSGPMILQFGGNLKDSAFADTDSWHHVLSFLQGSFGTSGTTQHS